MNAAQTMSWRQVLAVLAAGALFGFGLPALAHTLVPVRSDADVRRGDPAMVFVVDAGQAADGKCVGRH